MITLALSTGLLVSGAWILTALTGQRLHRTLPLFTGLLIASLYLSYVAGILHVAAWVLSAAIPVTLVGLLATSRWRRQHVLATLPQAAGLAFVLWVVRKLTLDSRVALWDELRLWGAYPKILHETSAKLQLATTTQTDGNGVLLDFLMRSYTPGLPLFQYFGMALRPFHEPYLFFAHTFLCVIFLMPLLRRASFRRPAQLVAGSVAMILVATFFSNVYNDFGDLTKALFVEPLVGLAIGYVCYLLARRAQRTPLGSLELGFAALTSYLVKDAGGPLAAVVLLIASVDVLALRARGRLRTGALLARLGRLWLPLALGAGLWTVLKKIYRPASVFTVDYAQVPYGKYLDGFRLALDRQPLRTLPGGLLPDLPSYQHFASLLLVASVALVVCARRRRVPVSQSLAAVLLVNVGQLAGVFVLVAAVFAGELRSFPRYLGSPLTAWLALVVMLAFDLWGRRERTSRTWLVRAGEALLALPLAVLLLSAPLRPPAAYPDTWFGDCQVWGADMRAQVRRAEPHATPDDPTRVFVLYTGAYDERVGHSHRLYFDSIGTGVNPDALYFAIEVLPPANGGPRADGDTTPAAARLAATLQGGGWPYLYAAEVDDRTRSQLGSLFEGGPQQGRLYRVQTVDGSVRLVPVR